MSATLRVHYPDGTCVSLPIAQAFRLGEAIKEFESRGVKTVWHFNHCGCCVSVHPRGGGPGWVIGDDGGADWLEVAP